MLHLVEDMLVVRMHRSTIRLGHVLVVGDISLLLLNSCSDGRVVL